MDSYTISEECHLPSEGKIYTKSVNPCFRIRSMTTEEEMKRLAYAERAYELLSEIIDDCIVGEGPGMSVYDMCLGDYQYLLHQLRIATYGPEYSLNARCPFCGEVNNQQIDLTTLGIKTYSEDVEDYKTCLLPCSDKEVTLKFQTPRLLDDTADKVREFKKKATKEDPSKTLPNVDVLYTVMSLIDRVEGKKLNPIELENFVRKLPMLDTSFIIQTADALNAQIGLDARVPFRCGGCGRDYDAPFQFTADFFGPKVRP